MKSRQDVVKLIQKQMQCENMDPMKENMHWHYGILELRELMDFIYEGTPSSEEYLVKI